MATATIPHVNFTRDDLNAAGTAALAKVGYDPKWTKIIYRALENLAKGQFIYDGHVVTLKSASSELVYRIDVREPMKCRCKGRQKGYTCWHITAARLIVRAAEINRTKAVYYKGFWYTPEQLEAAAQARKAAGYIPADVQAKADELYA